MQNGASTHTTCEGVFLLINNESIEHGVGPRGAPVTVYRYGASGDVDNAEVIGQGIVVHIETLF